MLEIIAGIVLVLLVFYYQYNHVYSYWRDRGFPYIDGCFPWGNLKDMALLRRFQGEVIQEMYNRLSPHPYGGLFLIRRPQLLLRDPDIIKHVMTKEFSHFRDRLQDNNGVREPLSDHLFNLRSDKWKATRVKLTPTFSSGKLKGMYILFEACAANFDKVLETEAEKSSIVDIKSLMARFTMDTIGTCAFGLDIRSLDNPDNELLKFGRAIFSASVRIGIKARILLYNLWPPFQKIYQFRNIPDAFSKAVTTVVTNTVDYREKNKINRRDFLDLLIELKNKGNVEQQSESKEEAEEYKDLINSSPTHEPLKMNMNFVVAQCAVFFLAGLETSSSVSSYCLYELALNQNLQDRLRKEIDTVCAKLGGLSYQAIQEMTFLDQCISETMRKYPTIPILTRICTRSYKLPDSGLTVEEGTRVIIPVYALHHDPEYFPDPEKFDPDRFSAERKSSIKQYTYMPFGEGPRLCIGMRFGLLQTKMGICTVLTKYQLSPCSETQTPLNLVGTSLITAVEGDIKLQVKHRKSAYDE